MPMVLKKLDFVARVRKVGTSQVITIPKVLNLNNKGIYQFSVEQSTEMQEL